MGLSDDQRAMLRLLAQREQGYDDIAALMGLSVDEVRARVKDALDQLEAEGKEPPVVPAPAAEPEPPVAEPEAPTPTTPEPAVPEAKPEPPKPAPPPPPPPPVEPEAAGAPRQPSGDGPRLRLPKDPGARVAIAAGAVVLVALVVVLIVSGGSGGSPSNTTAAGSGSAASEGSNASTGSAKGLTKADLEPAPGGEGSGEAIFGRYKNKLALQVIANGLEPSAKGESYTVWIARSPKKMLPLASAEANSKGQIRAEFEVPTEVLAYLANETFSNVVISRTKTPVLEAALGKATKEEKPPIYTGTPVLEGEITGPIVGVAKREQEKKE